MSVYVQFNTMWFLFLTRLAAGDVERKHTDAVFVAEIAHAMDQSPVPGGRLSPAFIFALKPAENSSDHAHSHCDEVGVPLIASPREGDACVLCPDHQADIRPVPAP